MGRYQPGEFRRKLPLFRIRLKIETSASRRMKSDEEVAVHGELDPIDPGRRGTRCRCGMGGICSPRNTLQLGVPRWHSFPTDL